MSWFGPHLLSVDLFSRDTVEALLQVAHMLEPIAQRQKITRVLEGAVLANLFFEPSTRTRVSFGAAFARLGGSVCDTTSAASTSLAKGESLEDTSRVLSGYADAIVMRHPEIGSVAHFAKSISTPVINAGDGAGEHPSQALLDLYTIQKEFHRLGKTVDGAHIVLSGDLKYSRTIHSLIKLLTLYDNLSFTLIAPPFLTLPTALADLTQNRGHRITVHHSLQEAIQPPDVWYATRLQKERFTDAALQEGREANTALQNYGPAFEINSQVIEHHCTPHTILMHPLPRDNRPGAHDLSTDLDADPRLAIFRQAANGIPIRMAIFAILLDVVELARSEMQPVRWKHRGI